MNSHKHSQSRSDNHNWSEEEDEASDKVGTSDSSDDDHSNRKERSPRSKTYWSNSQAYSRGGDKHGHVSSGHGNQGHGNGHKATGNRSRMHSSKVHMPTGTLCEITQPVQSKWRCGSKIKLINLNPRGIMGRKEYNIVENEMQQTIMNHPNCDDGGGCFRSYKIIKIQKILQGCIWRKYQARKTDVALENRGNDNERMLFHGTPHVWGIIAEGFDERKAKDGKLGSGLYFTTKSSAANQFVFGFFGGDGCKRHKNKNCYICERQLLLCRVTLGSSQRFIYSSLGQMSHPDPGYQSAYGMPGEGGYEYDEYVVYRGEQAYPEYLITYKIVR